MRGINRMVLGLLALDKVLTLSRSLTLALSQRERGSNLR
jgi:hypothetical protein